MHIHSEYFEHYTNITRGEKKYETAGSWEERVSPIIIHPPIKISQSHEGVSALTKDLACSVMLLNPCFVVVVVVFKEILSSNFEYSKIFQS